MLLFLKNKSTVFFSLLAPILILIIYVFFMGNVQVTTIQGMMSADIANIVDESTIRSIVNAWMVSGVVGIACITVALNSMLSVVQDRESGAVNDFKASPISPVKLLCSYFLAAVIITFSICLIVLIIVISYLWISTGVGFSFESIMELLLILLLSCLSAVIIMMCIMSFFKSGAGSTAFTGVFSALIGFLTGAYFPLGFLPEGVQNFASLIPGTHSTSLFRNVFIGNILKSLPSDIPADFTNQVKGTYSFNLKLFGAEFTAPYMYIFLGASVAVFFLVYLIIDRIRAGRKN